MRLGMVELSVSVELASHQDIHKATTADSNSLRISVLYEYAIATYFTYCHIFRIFQQSAHIAYFFHINWHF